MRASLLVAPLVALLVGAAPAVVSAAGPITLDDARRRAQADSLDVQLARWDALEADGAAQAALGGALPSIAGFVSGSAGAGLTSFGFERPTASQIGAGVTGRFALVDPSTWTAATAARRTHAGREATVRWVRVEARREATVLLARALAEQRVAEALALAAEDAAKEADAVGALVAAGLRPAADGARVRAQQLDFVARASEANGRAVAACAALQNLMRVEIDGACVLGDLPLGPKPADGPEKHPALVAAEAAAESADLSRTSAIAGLLPTVSVDGTAAHYTVPGRIGGFGWGVGFTVDIPLRIAGEGPGEIKRSGATLRKASAAWVAQHRELTAARVSAEGEWTAAQDAIAARRGSLTAADAALRLVSERYRTGLTSVTDLLDARAARTEAAVGLRRAEATLWSALAALEAARGVE